MNFQSLEVVDRGSKTQFQVIEIPFPVSIKIIIKNMFSSKKWIFNQEEGVTIILCLS